MNTPVFRRACAASLLVTLLSSPLHAWADDAGGLDLTMQVLGKDDRFDDRLVNRILIPGVGGAARAEAAAAERASAREERQAAREERRSQRFESRERRRDRGD